MPKRKTIEGFIIEAINCHGHRYDYNLVELKTTNSKVKIICSLHGIFEQTPAKHLIGRGCPLCAGNRKETAESFILKARAIHGTKYDYSKVEYKSNKTAVLITCPAHGDFLQTPSDHTNQKSGCPVCGSISTGRLKRLSHLTFLERVNAIHGDRYDYSLAQYVGGNKKINIICHEHGVFSQLASVHLNGSGCPVCGDERIKEHIQTRQKKTTDQFIAEAKQVHGRRYDYSETNYISANEKVKIICPEHGAYEQLSLGHLRGNGCSKCADKKRGAQKRNTLDDFVNRAVALHGNLYDYSYSEYINSNTRIKIICPVHGEFYQVPYVHLSGAGCWKCGQIQSGLSQRKSTEQFLESARKTHGNRYDYSETQYSLAKQPVKINCRVHGQFEQLATVHLRGGGCPQCSYNVVGEKLKFSTEEFVDKAKAIHGNCYDYSATEYSLSNQPIKINCRIHGQFEQLAAVHLRGGGCIKCAREKLVEKLRSSTEEFIQRGKAIHGDKYDYSFVDYETSTKKVKIICPNHGVFEQTPSGHLTGAGCDKCGSEVRGDKSRKPVETFLSEAFSAHGERYNYSLVDYRTAHKKVKIICPEHGIFEQSPNIHIKGRGCPKCNYGHGVGTYDEDYFKRNPDQIDVLSTIYYVRFSKNGQNLYKIGIDSNGKRWPKTYRGWEVTILKRIVESKYNCWLYESDILELNKAHRYKVKHPDFVGNGATEMFHLDILNEDNNS